MWGRHLKQRGRWWHYYRATPAAYTDVEPRRLISFSLATTDFAEARALAAQHSLALERQWSQAKQRGVSLAATDRVERHAAAIAVQTKAGFQPCAVETMADDELITRLRKLLTSSQTPAESKAMLGLVEAPTLGLMQAFERFWEHIRDEWATFAHDQRRNKRNVYLRAIRNFERANGAVSLFDIERQHAMAFRVWWQKRVETEGLQPYAANREISCLRRLYTVIADIDSVDRPNPFARVRLKDLEERSRMPFTTEFIRDQLLVPETLAPLPDELRLLVRLMVNTGMRPSEAIGLELADIDIAAPVPFVHIRRNGTRAIKTAHSERQIPVVGVSLRAAQAVVAAGGWGKWAGKNVYATSVINKHFRQSGLLKDPKLTLYSLRHWFQDQLTKRDVVDRAQAQLMGHKFHRPKYGYGKDLVELREIIVAFAIE